MLFWGENTQRNLDYYSIKRAETLQERHRSPVHHFLLTKPKRKANAGLFSVSSV